MKSDLLSRYLTEALRLYQSLSEDLKARLRNIQQDGVSSVVLVGADEACEAIRKAAREIGLEVVAAAEMVHGLTARMTMGGGGDAAAERARAVLVADTGSSDLDSKTLERFKQQGFPIYHV